MVRYEVFSGKTAEKQPEMSIVKRVEGRGICQDPQRYAQGKIIFTPETVWVTEKKTLTFIFSYIACDKKKSFDATM